MTDDAVVSNIAVLSTILVFGRTCDGFEQPLIGQRQMVTGVKILYKAERCATSTHAMQLEISAI